MKLIFAVVQGKDADTLLAALLEAEYRVTQINSAGGFLQERNATFLIGVEDAQVEDVLTDCQAELLHAYPICESVASHHGTWRVLRSQSG